MQEDSIDARMMSTHWKNLMLSDFPMAASFAPMLALSASVMWEEWSTRCRSRAVDIAARGRRNPQLHANAGRRSLSISFLESVEILVKKTQLEGTSPQVDNKLVLSCLRRDWRSSIDVT